MRCEVMRLRIGEVFVEAPDGLTAHRGLRPHHVKGVHIRVIHIHACRNAAGFEPFCEEDRFSIERLPVAHEGIGGR